MAGKVQATETLLWVWLTGECLPLSSPQCFLESITWRWFYKLHRLEVRVGWDSIYVMCYSESGPLQEVSISSLISVVWVQHLILLCSNCWKNWSKLSFGSMWCSINIITSTPSSLWGGLGVWDCHGDKDSARPACGKGAPLSLNPLTLMTCGQVPWVFRALLSVLHVFFWSHFPGFPGSEWQLQCWIPDKAPRGWWKHVCISTT